MASERIQRRIDSLLDEADAAISRYDWEALREAANAVLRLDPGNSDALSYLAAAERDPGRDQPSSTPPSETPPVSTPHSEPTSFANGRYEVKRFLGEGGKKRVYLAQDTLLDREVAFALIKTEVLAQGRGTGHIFISHVAEDSSIAIQAAEALEAKDYSTWYYERDSVPGPAYLAQMGEAIDRSQAMVLIISPQSVGSNQVTTEVVRAHEDNKAFIPLLCGISHEEFQRRAPVWRQALGASTSIELSEGQIGEVVGRVIDGLAALGIRSAEQGREEERSRITREAQAMARLGDHPHVLQIHDLGEENGQPYLVLPFMPGGDVQVLIEQAPDHRLPLEQVVKIAKEVCRGLEFAHSRGIVHRDLKPSNVWMTTDGTAKLGDFGLAVAADRIRLTQEGMMVGTLTLTLQLNMSAYPGRQVIGADFDDTPAVSTLNATLG